jgi:hypothetical protein
MFSDNNGTFVVEGSVTFLYFDLRYRDEVTVWTAINLISVTEKVRKVFLVYSAFRSAEKCEIFTLIGSSHNVSTTYHHSE